MWSAINEALWMPINGFANLHNNGKWKLIETIPAATFYYHSCDQAILIENKRSYICFRLLARAHLPSVSIASSDRYCSLLELQFGLLFSTFSSGLLPSWPFIWAVLSFKSTKEFPRIQQSSKHPLYRFRQNLNRENQFLDLYLQFMEAR